MKYSLRALAVFFLVVGLCVALIVAGFRIRQLNLEMKVIQETLGFIDDERPSDRYQIKSLQYRLEARMKFGVYLLRVENYQKYQLEITAYDGNKHEKTRFYASLDEPLIAITMNPKDEIEDDVKVVTIDSTLHSKNSYVYNFHFPGEVYFEARQGDHEDFNECIFSLFFIDRSQAVDREGLNGSKMSPATSEQVQELCDKYKLYSIYFRIVPR